MGASGLQLWCFEHVGKPVWRAPLPWKRLLTLVSSQEPPLAVGVAAMSTAEMLASGLEGKGLLKGTATRTTCGGLSLSSVLRGSWVDAEDPGPGFRRLLVSVVPSVAGQTLISLLNVKKDFFFFSFFREEITENCNSFLGKL